MFSIKYYFPWEVDPARDWFFFSYKSRFFRCVMVCGLSMEWEDLHYA